MIYSCLNQFQQYIANENKAKVFLLKSYSKTLTQISNPLRCLGVLVNGRFKPAFQSVAFRKLCIIHKELRCFLPLMSAFWSFFLASPKMHLAHQGKMPFCVKRPSTFTNVWNKKNSIAFDDMRRYQNLEPRVNIQFQANRVFNTS